MAKVIIGILVACIIGGIAFWFWTTTPQYSLKKLAESVHDHDLATFQTYLDVDSVSTHAIDDLSSDQIRAIGGENVLKRFLGLTLAGIFKPQLTKSMQTGIINYVATKPGEVGATEAEIASAQIETEAESPRKEGFLARVVEGVASAVVEVIKPPSVRDVLRDMGLTKENYRGISYCEVKDKLCHVGLKFQPPDKAELIVELELEKMENQWKVVRFSNLDTLAKSVSRI